MDLICRKLDVREGMRVLDIGCGWAGFAMYAAEKYGAHVTGVSVSREQIEPGNGQRGFPSTSSSRTTGVSPGRRPDRVHRHVRARRGE